jgi:hypothetical protein
MYRIIRLKQHLPIVLMYAHLFFSLIYSILSPMAPILEIKWTQKFAQ